MDYKLIQELIELHDFTYEELTWIIETCCEKIRNK